MKVTVKNGIMPKGSVALPPSKSEAIRAALLLGACGADPMLAVGDYPGAPLSDDVRYAMEAARSFFSPKAYVGESAALLRMLLPFKALTCGADITGAPRVFERGIGELEDCLSVRASIDGGRLVMSGEGLRDKRVFAIDCSRSSQFLSGLLIALPLMDRECEIVIKNGLVSAPYARMTLAFVRLFGGRIEETGTGFITRPSAYSVPERIPVTGDRSYAAVFEAMDILGGSVGTVGASGSSLQPDGRFSELAKLDECDITDCPDIMPLLAVAACAKKGETVIRGTARLRAKESDRGAGAAELVNALGGSAEVSGDSVTVRGTGELAGGAADPRGDHRLAFAAAAAALICRSPVTVVGAECVNKSAPQFWEDMRALGLIEQEKDRYGQHRKHN